MALPTESWRNEKVSEQRLDIDIALAAHRTVRVRGRVQRPTGQPLSGEAVILARSVTPGAILTTGNLQTRTAADGGFAFNEVAPATYIVRSGGGAVGSASTTITVTDAEIGNLLLVPRTGSTSAGPSSPTRAARRSSLWAAFAST